jgi:outer membrane biosynthesis protein TonB
MSTGPSSDSAEAPPEPEPPFTGGRRHSWLASHGRHPVTWAVAGVVLLGSAGVALLQEQPGGRARTQSVYCGLVKCAVLRSVADSSTATVAVPRPSPALPSPKAPSSAPASTPTPATTPAPTPARSRPPKPVAAPKPAPAPSPKPPATPTPNPSPTWAPRPPRRPWPPTWGWPWGGGGGRHSRPSSHYWQPGGRHQRGW